MDEGTLSAAMTAGMQAKRELAMTGEAFAKLREEYTNAWESTGARDTDARERLWQAVQILGKVEAQLKAVVDNGKIAEKQLEEIKRAGEKRGFFR